MGQTGISLSVMQSVFVIVFAVSWGTMSSVLGRWKAFNYGLLFVLPQVLPRLLLSWIFLNLIPWAYLALGLWALADRAPPMLTSWDLASLTKITVHSLVPGFLVPFGFYRLWLAVVEFVPYVFYRRELKPDSNVPEKSDPTVLVLWPPGFPRRRSAATNMFFALAYVVGSSFLMLRVP